MNIMRKLRSRNASGEASTENCPDSPRTQLGIMHLKKLFSEYAQPKTPLSETERDYKLYTMLPLFCKVFGTTHASEMGEKFWDITEFCQQVSRLIVSEIRRRASNQSTEAASIAIVKFLEIENCEESSNGWMLLSALNILASGDASLIQVMTAASVPSTLVKCLYLFFDLPEIPEEEADITDESEFTIKERRILLQKMFVQILVRLCSYTFSAEELTRMDDLTLLFSAITSQCPPHNVMWRKTAAEVLTTLSRHGLTEPVVSYIHSKGCINLCIDNMQRVPQLAPLEIVEMFVSVFCFLKDSSEVSQVLLDDFRFSQGYVFLSDFLLKLEQQQDDNTEANAAIRNLVLMIATLCMCGFTELRPGQNQTSSIFQMQGFQIPQLSSHGNSVRNVHAFQVLQTVFLKSSSTTLCCLILDAISSVYHHDNANYFILESQNTLSQFAEKIYIKSVHVQEKFFELFEFVVFHLNFVPCKELISLSLLLKGNNSINCSILCIKTLLKILSYNNIFKDVYREVGMLEVFVTCLTKYVEFLETNVFNKSEDSEEVKTIADEPHEQLGKFDMEALTILLKSNNSNANVFRESGGAKCIHEMAKHSFCRNQALSIIRELVLSANGEDDMLFMLSSMHSAPGHEIELKIQILQTLLGCLRDSHRCRTIFRKVGGFVYVTSVFVSLDGKLVDDIATIGEEEKSNVLKLLHVVFRTLATAMRFEPANAKFFHNEICCTSFCDTIRLLGCFGPSTNILDHEKNIKPADLQTYYHTIFTGNILEPELSLDNPFSLSFICIIYRLLYDIALDNFDNPNLSGVVNIVSTNSDASNQIVQATTNPRSAVSTLNLTHQPPEPLVVHPGLIICMLQLLPSVEHAVSKENALCLQIYLAEVIKSLVRNERNQQIMCEYGLAGYLLKIGRVALSNEKNYLHVALQYVLERLAAQALQPTELREFLRLGLPLFCESVDLGKGYDFGGSVPLTRIKTLVSMTTPRDFRAYGSCILPPFVEMDMTAEGFGCLYLPSIAPQVPNSSGSIDGSVIGGIGCGDRIFPPQTGISYSTWFCVDKFSDPRTDPHSVRLLTLVRTINNQKEDNLICLTVLLSARDKAIIVSTQEALLPNNDGGWEPEGTGESSVRIWCPDLLREGQWHHLVIVLNRAVLKNSGFSLFLDGQHMHTQKLFYISQNPGAGAANLAIATSVYAFIGTPPMWRRYSRLCWKQGVCHLIEDILTPQTVSTIFALGPHYMGSLQAPQLGKQDEPMNPLVPEERIIFGLNAKAVSHLTLAKIRKVYSRVDNKTIAKHLGMSSHENATPIRVLHNAAGHLAGPARTLGGVVVGYLGVRVFSPHPVSTMMDTVGGCSVLLGIIAMAQDVETLYAGVKALTCVVRSNRAAQIEMDRRRSYQTLAMFFRKKRNLLNSHILHLTFTLVGTVNSGQEATTIPNIMAFEDLLCDMNIWLGAPNGLLRSLLEHLLEIASETSEKRSKIKIMRDLQLVTKLLHIIVDVGDNATREILFSLLEVLMGGQPRQEDLLYFGQYIAAKLPQCSIDSEKNIDLSRQLSKCNSKDESNAGEVSQQIAEHGIVKNILLRNRCLTLLHTLLFTPRNTVNSFVCDEISRILGMDWVLLFMQSNVHSSSVILSMRILVVMCANETLNVRFKEGTYNGGYLRYTELISKNKGLVLEAPQFSPSAKSTSFVPTPNFQLPAKIAGEVKIAVLQIPGYQHLEWLLPNHLDVPEVYYLLTALIMGQPVKLLAKDHTKIDLDRVWAFLWGAPVSQTSIGSIAPRINLCSEAVCVMLKMVRTIVHSDQTEIWLANYPESIIQVLFSLYHNLPEFMPVMMSADVINSLAAVLFPLEYQGSDKDSEAGSGASTPDEVTNTSVLVQPPIRSETQLTNHPVRTFVVNFFRVIIVDSLSLSFTGKTAPAIDLVLDGFPEKSEFAQQVAFQTEIISALMEHLLAADVLVGEQAALPIVPLHQSHVQNIPPNVFYLTARIVDKMWQGNLKKDPHEIFDFIVKLIVQAKRRSVTLTLEQLHHSLNRSILYLLSRPTDSVADQMAILEALHKLTTHRLLIFGAGNHELDFIGCLSFCLLQLTFDQRIISDPQECSNSKWHLKPEIDETQDEYLTQHQGKNLIVGAAFRVWEELYVCKKPAIEEVFKISLTQPLNNAKAPDLAATRDQVIDSATKLWFNYVDSERKSTYRVPWEIHNQIQSKIQKVTGGLTRLTSRNKARKDEFIKTKSKIERNKAFLWTSINIKLVRELWEMRCMQRSQMMHHIQRYVYQEWLQSEAELTRERGLWGPERGSPLDKWVCDSTEGPHRMRKKTMKNNEFYIHYPYRPELELPDNVSNASLNVNRQLKYKVATSFDSKLHHTHGQPSQRILCDTESSFDHVNNRSTDLPATPTDSSIDNDQNDDMYEEELDASVVSDNQTLLRMLEEQEKISYIFRCARIEGLDTTEGVLLFGKEHCYVVDGFTLLKNREIRDIDSLPSGTYEPILPNAAAPRRCAIRQCSKFSYEDIREVHKRRYLLQPIALEVFSGDGRNHLLSFPRKIRNKVYQRFMATATAIADSAHQSVAGQKRTANVEQAAGIFSSLIGETSVTQRWVRGEISNFQYLMHLNTLAGRSYNDLMQYPVFPWILADYDSVEIDLTSPQSFRDFAKPMGAQSAERLEQFQKRYKEWDDPHGETPPYHYGTHYSSAMIVCSYLVRLEPFTQHFLRLQGGHFDLADRMFHSIKEAWLSASRYNMADVKELIPEFFYLPEFLTNTNNFDLGSKQNGDLLGDIILPPWAKQDPREFIRVHREALECDYVSQHLHQWIDLIFGCKQQGQTAVEAINVFHHLFYEGNVDIYNIDDPLKKNATIGFINNFGQIPKQLFKKAHPCKKMPSNRNSVIDPNPILSNSNVAQPDKLFIHNLDNLKPSLQPVKELKGPVGQIYQYEKTLHSVEQNKVMMPPSCTRYIAWGFADHSLRIGMYDSDRALFVCETSSQNCGEILACTCPNTRLIVTAGTSSVVNVWEYNSRRKILTVKNSLHGHTDAVTCLTSSSAYNVIVSGSRDGTAIIWDMSRFMFVRQLRDHVGVVSAVSINELTGDIATCSSTWLHVWSINGDLLATVNTSIGCTDRMQQILCVAFSSTREWDQQNVVITGSTDGVVRMWSMEHVQIPISKPKPKPIEEQITVVVQREKPKIDLVKQMSLSTEEQGLTKSESESSISEALASEKENVDNNNDIIATLPAPSECNSRRQSIKSNMLAARSLDEFEDIKKDAESNKYNAPKKPMEEPSDKNAGRGIRPSKSDTSLTDSFVVIDNEYISRRSNQNVLRDGFKWQRQLVFRSKLTMHTAYDRKDNAEPASITALSVSKDHKTLYVGDARGRVFSWTFTEQPGRGVADHWHKDEGVDNCVGCNAKFTLYERKHHCRNCGQVFCNKCSRFESEISRLRILKPVRVCQGCYATLRHSLDN